MKKDFGEINKKGAEPNGPAPFDRIGGGFASATPRRRFKRRLHLEKLKRPKSKLVL